MSIRPASPDQPSHAGRLAGQPVASPVSRARPQDPAGVPPGADRVELSNVARELSGAGDVEAIPVETLVPARLREIAGRLAGGFYDRPEVRDAVVRRAARDL
jgi:hypothetical protein